MTAKFPATPEGDADLVAFLRTGRPPSETADEERLSDLKAQERDLRRLLEAAEK